MAKSRVVRFYEEGGPEVLRVEDVEVGAPGPNEVRILVEAIGLNRAEAMFRGGYYYERAERRPAVIGYEAAGVVDAVGDGVVGFEPGQPVSVVPSFSMTRYGVYGEKVIVPAHALVRRPAGQDAVSGAATWMSGLTAYGGLVEVGGLRAGDTVLITAAASSVGLAAIQIANRLGATPIATTRTGRKRERLLAAGAAHVIATDEESVVDRVRELTGGRGADLVFDGIFGRGLSDLALAAAKEGKLIVYGLLGGHTAQGSFGADAPPFPVTNVSLTMRWYAMMDTALDPERLRRGKQFVLSGLRAGSLAPIVDRTFDLGEIVEAHRYLESGAQLGKVIVTVNAGRSGKP
ncbi:zinc-dependent alcohol dehydrogenase family protein [Sorangium sp. So ce1078]|uniref:zinc-dependent alcohol dehydrogenase family protein n=1 Tax=Sorangium sp. So ce1078 TaxID=3133329 RepID=UPI003F5E7AD2